MPTVGLGLGSSLCWGFADFIGGMQSRRLPVATVMAVSQATALAILTVILVASAGAAPDTHYLVVAAVAGAGSMVALGAFYKALAIGTMSIVAPIASTGAAVPVVVGLATGDRPGAIAMLGILVAITGVVLASREGEATGRGSATARRAVWLALVAALGFGSYFVAMDEASGASVIWALFVSRLAGAVAVGAFVLATSTGLRGVREGRRLPVLVLAGCLDCAAVAFYAIGTNEGLLSVLAVLSSLYPVVPVIMGRVVLGERLQRVQQLGVAGALTGVVLIAAG